MVYSDYFFKFLYVRQVTDMPINHPRVFLCYVLVSDRQDFHLKFVYLLPAGGRQVGQQKAAAWLHKLTVGLPSESPTW